MGERVVSFENENKCSVVASYMYKEKYARICMSFFLASAMYNILSGQGENVWHTAFSVYKVKQSKSNIILLLHQQLFHQWYQF